MTTLRSISLNVACLALLFCGGRVYGQQAPRLGLTLYTDKACDGYSLFAPKHYSDTYLIDNEGQIVHSWTGSHYEPGQTVYLLENGHLMRSCMVKGKLSSGGGEGGRIEEYDWDGNLVWQLDFSTDQYMQHHDFKPLPNGNVLLLAVEKKTYSEAVAAFGPTDFIWTYKADPPSALYSGAISAAQRLPNGNTLICDGVHGVFLEVTALGETVWMYVNPVVLTGPLVQGSQIPPDPAREGEFMNAVFKVYRYDPDYPGLAGRDLTPKGTVELYGR